MNNKSVMLPVVLFVSIICLFDFFTRLQPAENSLKNNSNYSDSRENTVNILAVEEFDSITQLLAQFDVVKKEEPVVSKPENKPKKKQVNIMSLEEQQKQQGQLTDLFDGENKYTLVATLFDSQKKFAIISQVHLPTSAKKQLKLYQNEKLGNYTLETIHNDSVEFSASTRTVQLHLFLIKNN